MTTTTTTTTSPTDDEISQAEALRRLDEAMDELQLAQNHLDRACSLLFHTIGASSTERKIWKARERVHALWYVCEELLRGKAKKWRLDGIVAAAFIAKVRGEAPKDGDA